jgi:hypothetical protein
MAPKNTINEDVEKDVPFYSSTLEDIDYAMYRFVDERLNLSTKTNKGFEKVPVVWAGAERAHNIKDDDISRDVSGMVALPIIVIEREMVKKDPAKRAIPYAMVDPTNDLKGGYITVNKVIKQDKTSNFANADAYRRKGQQNASMYKSGRGPKNKKIVYETITIPIPIYVSLMYKIYVKTEYQQQMNDMLSPIITSSNAHKRVFIEHNSNRYEAFIQEDYGIKNTIVNYESNERRYEATVSDEVVGYLIGDGKNQLQPRVVRRENAVQVRFARERVIMDTDDGDFRF